MGRFLCLIRKKTACRRERRRQGEEKLALCVLALCALLTATVFLPSTRKEEQPVFFSLLFAQLAPEWAEDEAPEGERWWEAMFL